jgi:hypothetical protein
VAGSGPVPLDVAGVTPKGTFQRWRMGRLEERVGARPCIGMSQVRNENDHDNFPSQLFIQWEWGWGEGSSLCPHIPSPHPVPHAVRPSVRPGMGRGGQRCVAGGGCGLCGALARIVLRQMPKGSSRVGVGVERQALESETTFDGGGQALGPRPSQALTVNRGDARDAGGRPERPSRIRSTQKTEVPV